MNGSLAPFWIDRTSRLPVDAVEAEHAFFTEIEILRHKVASWIACDLEQFFGADRSDAARMAAADVTKREWGLIAYRCEDGLLLLGQREVGIHGHSLRCVPSNQRIGRRGAVGAVGTVVWAAE